MIKIGTRSSALALKQTSMVIEKLKSSNKNLEIEIVEIKTTGDKITDKPLYDIGGKGLFTNEFEEALLKGTIDIAVHSAKDMPSYLTEEFSIGAVLERANPFDLLIFNKGTDINKENINIGTSSPRRKFLIEKLYPHCRTSLLRGNVPTRLEKLKNNMYDAIILAKAGIDRLGFDLKEQGFDYIILDEAALFLLHVKV